MKDAKPIRADALAVGILGGIQPDRLATLVLAGDDDGLAARILYIWPETGPPRRPDRAADDAAALAALRRIEPGCLNGRKANHFSLTGAGASRGLSWTPLSLVTCTG